jgi:hypothetical protein
MIIPVKIAGYFAGAVALMVCTILALAMLTKLAIILQRWAFQ